MSSDADVCFKVYLRAVTDEQLVRYVPHTVDAFGIANTVCSLPFVGLALFASAAAGRCMFATDNSINVLLCCCHSVLCCVCSLHFLFNKTLGKALKILDQGGNVLCFTATRSRRRIFVVRACSAPLETALRIHPRCGFSLRAAL